MWAEGTAVRESSQNPNVRDNTVDTSSCLDPHPPHTLGSSQDAEEWSPQPTSKVPSIPELTECGSHSNDPSRLAIS